MSTTIKKKSVGKQSSLKYLGFILLLLCSAMLYSQTKTITVHGIVTDPNGKPISGASVTSAKSTTGTSTDLNGAFELKVPDGSSIQFSSIGYDFFDIRVKDGSGPLQIKLTPKMSDLDQVVVVGYGTQKKRDVTGSVVSVNERSLREVPVPNLQQGLQGKAAGLEIQSTGSTPGSSGMIRIRGTKSINGSSDPLIILDGIPYSGSLSDINPDDIASVDVLKDASSTAIYGSRGANGVIMLTSKKGKAGVPKVSYNGYYGSGKVSFKYPVYNPAEYMAMRSIGTYSSGYMPIEKIGLAQGRTTDWQDLMYQAAHKTDNNLTVSGGSENGTTYSLGAGYYNENAVLPGQDFTRYSVRGNLDSRIGKKIRVGLNTLNTSGVTNGSQFMKYGLMFPILSLSPLSPSDTNGVTVMQPAGNPDDGLTYNPLMAKTSNNVDRITRWHSFNSLYGEYEIISGLRYRFNLGLDYIHEEDDQFKGQDTKNNDINQPHNYYNAGKGNYAYVNNATTFSYTAENLLYYDKTIKEKHRINFTGLYSIQETSTHNTSVSKDSIDQDFIQFYNLGQANTTHPPIVGGGEIKEALISYMARVNYAYDNRYMLTLTWRRDGSSHLAEGNKWHPYLGASAGWNITNEKFIKDVSWLSNLKLRAGYGQTSNQSVAAYSSLGQVSNMAYLADGQTTYKYNFGNAIVTGYNLLNLPNPSLDWEYTKTLNIGLDYGFLNGRITGAIDYYNQKTDKILYSQKLPPTSGVQGTYTTNLGNMDNWGMEFSVSSVNIKPSHASGFSWTTDLNLFFNKNKLTNLGDGSTKIEQNQLFVGYSMTSIYDYKKLGIWQTNEAAEAAKFNSVPGQLKLEDHSGPNGKPDGVIDNNDKYIIGNCDAKLQGGMTNRFAYKNFDLSIVMYARFGGLLISQIHQPTSLYLTQLAGNRNQIAVDYWTPNNPTNWFPSPANVVSPIGAAMSTLGYYDATFVKIKSINFGYSFQPSLLKAMHAQSLRAYVSVDNVATLFSPYQKQTGIDPEGTGTGDQSVSPLGNIRAGGFNPYITIGASTPRVRTVLLGLNVTF
jgi:TonB-linked SusC/RagA family outer membrane protein